MNKICQKYSQAKRHFTCICKTDIETTSGILKKLKLCLTITPSEIIVQLNGSCWGGTTGFQSILETNVKWRPLLQRNKGYTISEIEFMQVDCLDIFNR